MSQASPKIRVIEVDKTFGVNKVLDGVSLEIPAGSSTALIGTAASGKTVLLKCILGLHGLDGGRIEIDGKDLGAMSTGERLAMIDRVGTLFQYGGLFDSLPVWENIAFKLLNVRALDRREARAIAIEKLRLVGLAPAVAELYPASLSGGMQKRVGLARAFAGDPEILLLDNPTAGLDPIVTKQINGLIEGARSDLGATVLMITGDMKVAREESTYLAMIHDGRIAWAGPTAAAESADNPYLQQLIHGRGEGPITMRLRARLA